MVGDKIQVVVMGPNNDGTLFFSRKILLPDPYCSNKYDFVAALQQVRNISLINDHSLLAVLYSKSALIVRVRNSHSRSSKSELDITAVFVMGHEYD